MGVEDRVGVMALIMDSIAVGKDGFVS